MCMPDQPSPRRFQFRLRTLLIGVTLLAVPCAYIGWQLKIVRERQAEVNREVNRARLSRRNANAAGFSSACGRC
jgi:hypothetical protein